MLNKKTAVAVVCTLSIAGCGTSSPTPDTVANYDEYGSELERYLGEFTLGTDINEPASLPSVGDVTYDGVVSFLLENKGTQPGDDLRIRGNLGLTANFQDDTISGGADNFINSEDNTYSGAFAINGDIRNNPTGNDVTILGEIGGDIQNDQTGENLNLNGIGFADNADFAGDFYGENNAFIGGVIRGEITTADETLLISDNENFGIPDGDAIFVGGRE